MGQLTDEQRKETLAKVNTWLATGMNQKEACYKAKISPATFHLWRKKFNGCADPNDGTADYDEAANTHGISKETCSFEALTTQLNELASRKRAIDGEIASTISRLSKMV